MAINRIKDLERFDDLCRIYVDPLVVLFKTAAGCLDMGPDFIDEDGNTVQLPVPANERRMAASELCGYRYAKFKAVEHSFDNSAEGWSFVVQPPTQAPPQVINAQPSLVPLPDPSSDGDGPVGVEHPIPAADEFV
jgi:hypothetical protein